MSVREYYYAHFDELAPEKQFHFATRMKNYFKIHDFDDFLWNHVPSSDLAPVFENNNYSRVNNYAARKPFFEKYNGLYGIEAALFRVHHLLVEYNIDIREQFLEFYPKAKLYKLSDDLMNDKKALQTLSTWAINTICLTEELYPRGVNVVKELADFALSLKLDDNDPMLLSYLYTHIILCDSGFYTKDLASSGNLTLVKEMLEKCAQVIAKNIDTISLDACIEFLVCCNMAGVEHPELRTKIAEICEEFKKDSPYLINYRRDKTPGSYFHTLNGAEHINALYIMSGLDS